MTDQSKIDAFISKWGPSGSGFALNERQGAQQHFLELCNVIGVEPPTGVNDGVTDYLFEKQTLMLGERRGYADVFKRNVFAWEYKAPGKSLDGALSQLMRYAMALGNPPLLRKLNEARDRWLNPPEWTKRKAEVVLGFPEKIIPLPGHENDLKKRTLTNLYNSSPPWLRNLHALLDEAVAAAYGWEWPINDDQIIQRLFYLNQTRAL